MRRPGIAILACAALLGATPAGERVTVPGGSVTIGFARDPGALDRGALRAWVRHSAEAVAGYYGRFPVGQARLVVSTRPGHGVGGGRTWAHDGALIRIRVGEDNDATDYADDWVLVHEMTHLALPSLPDEQEWLEEGLATYVEPIARAQAGQLSDEAVWGGMVRGLPNGLPRAGDRGLDRTHTWGRTYWGGALFCLLADLEIRRRTQGRRSLQDALRAILARGNMETSSTVAPLLAIGDEATGTMVLSDFYARFSDSPEPFDLEALWRRLGVVREGRTVRFDDGAPEAALRRALTRPRS
jgi:hypothetical protein